MDKQQNLHRDMAGINLFKFVPVSLLLLVWLVTGRSDPGAEFQGLTYLRWLSYPVIVSASILWVLKFSRTPKIKVFGGEYLLTGIVLVLICSYHLNNDSLKNVVYGLLVYLRYPVFFLLLINNIDFTEEFLPFVKSMVIISLFLIAEALNNFFAFGYQGDLTFISLGHKWGHAVAGVWIMYAYLFLFAKSILEKKRRGLVLILFFFVIGVFLISSIRSGLIYIPTLMLLLLAIYFNIFKARWLPYVSGVLVLSTLGFSLYTYHICYGILPLPHDVNPQFRLNYIAGVLGELYNRGELFFGAGPRSMAPGSLGAGGKIYQLFLLKYPELQYGGTNQYVKVFPELGIVGFALYWWVLYKLIKLNVFVWDILKYKENEQLMDRAISLSFFPIWFHYSSLGLFNNDLWRFDISSLIFWTLSSYICVLYFQNNHSCTSYVIRY